MRDDETPAARKGIPYRAMNRPVEHRLKGSVGSTSSATNLAWPIIKNENTSVPDRMRTSLP